LNILFFQYGDFGEAYRRFQEHGPETYRDQRASVDFVASLQTAYEVTTVAVCDRDHDEDLDKNLRSIGIGSSAAYDRRTIVQLLGQIQPDLIVCRTPHHQVIKWARRSRVPTLLTFADFFSNSTLRELKQNIDLRMQLYSPVFPCVANHSLNASISVSKALFYPSARIVPWEFRRLAVEGSCKTAPMSMRRPSAFFAGALIAQKGVDDCLQAVAILQKRGINLTLQLAGPGDVEAWRRRAAELGVGDKVRFLGVIPNAAVRDQMVKSDLVIVPSRHDYAEGLPNTIYEALASRTPLIISDHPAFAKRLQDRNDCMIFRAADASSLADRIATLLSDTALFALLSERSAAALDSLYVGLDWIDLVANFLDDPHNRAGWVEANSLARALKDVVRK
jgi:glycosyltransferase involved in cell wall biosynthesis